MTESPGAFDSEINHQQQWMEGHESAVCLEAGTGETDSKTSLRPQSQPAARLGAGRGGLGAPGTGDREGSCGPGWELST